MPLRGAPLPLRLRNFRPQPTSGVARRAAAYMVRLREIEAMTAATSTPWRRSAGVSRRSPPGELARAWRATAEAWSFDEVNDLIARHNRWYPVESRLPMDPRRGDFALVNGRDYRLRPLDAGWVLERFPP